MVDEKKVEGNLPDIVEPQKTEVAPKLENKKTQKPEKAKNIPKNQINLPKESDSLQDLLLKNIKLSEMIFEQNKKIKRRLTLMVVGNYFKLLLIVVPLIIAFIYLPPLINQLLLQYNSILGGAGGGQLNLNSILGNISPQDTVKLQEMLKGVVK